MNPILWILTFIGHLGSWCVVYNRTHATSWPRKLRKRCEKVVIASVLMPMLWFAGRMITAATTKFETIAAASPIESIYLWGSFGMGIFFFLRWSWRKFKPQPKSILSHAQSIKDIQQQSGRSLYITPLAKTLKRIPFNQSHLIATESMELGLKQLPAELDGLRICQLSDFHLTGQIDRLWFEQVVEAANRFEPDLILITGDLIDEFECLDWIEPIFGRLSSKHGTFFVRGNHDLRIADQQMLLQRLQSAGLRWIGGQFVSQKINGIEIKLAGNELPWFAGAESLQPEPVDSPTFQILLTHTPDQIQWAKPFGFDLIFAGHNHGGQIALPVVGPIVAPSKFGVLYAAGTFEIDGAVMHVSRGLSGDECIRINCPPEVGCFTLRQVDP